MKRFATLLIAILILPAPIYAGSWQNSAGPASECRGVLAACNAAANELKAARELIAGYEAYIAASDERIALARKEIAALKEANTLERRRAAELQEVIDAERAAKSKLIELKEIQEKRVARLEGQLRRSRKFNLITATAAVIGILIAVAK